MTIEELTPIVSRFRRAIEESDLSENSVGREASIRMQDFPSGACAETSEILGIFLRNEKRVNPLLPKMADYTESLDSNHEWIEHKNLTIDITADQFDEITDKTIVAEESEFHNNRFDRVTTSPDTLGWRHQPDWMRPLYDVVVAKYDELENNENQD